MEWVHMTDEEFSAAVKKIRKETEYYKNIDGCIFDGFCAMVLHDRSSEQYIYMEEWPHLSPPQSVTREQFQILKKELRKLDMAKG